MKKLLKVLICIIVAAALITAAVFLVKRIKKQNILTENRSHGAVSEFYFCESGSYAGKTEYTYTAQTGLAKFSYTAAESGETNTAEQTFTDEQISEFTEYVNAADIPHWQQSYKNDSVIDATSWSVTVVYADGTRFTSEGSGETPQGFAQLISGIKAVFPYLTA